MFELAVTQSDSRSGTGGSTGGEGINISRPDPPGEIAPDEPPSEAPPRQGSPDTSEPDQSRWLEASIATVLGVGAWGGAQLALVGDGTDVDLVQTLLIVGIIGIGTAVLLIIYSYRHDANRRHHELIQAIESISEEESIAEAIEALRRQQELIEELRRELPEQRDQIEELSESLPEQQEIITDLIQEEISDLEELAESLER